VAAIEYEVPTPRGLAEVVLEGRTRGAPGVLILGHGAGGGIDAVDLVAVRDGALDLGLVVARVTQPYRVLSARRPPPAAPALDEAWVATVAAVRARAGQRRPFVVGGRSSGARVAARTAKALGAAGVLALAFPLHAPGRPEASRAAELDPAMPTLVVNGDRDPFGVPVPAGLIRVVVVPGATHDLRRDPAAVARATTGWLTELFDLAADRRAETGRRSP
jgi:predicted alpha/beta-hydrolase family hydrolase